MKNAISNKYHKIVVNDFSAKAFDSDNYSDIVTAKFFYNVSTKERVVKNGIGISQATVPTEETENSSETALNTSALSLAQVNKLLHFKQYFPNTNTTTSRILLHASNKKLYVHEMYSGVGTFLWLYSLEFDTAPICLTYKLNGSDTIILSSPEKMVVWTTNLAPYTTTNVPIITSMCIYNGVLFCTIAGEANKLWYCTSLNPELIGTTSSTSKYFSLDDERGYARKILTFKEGVYAFRDYGITKINYYGVSDVRANPVYLSDSMIYSNTVTVCGDVILFMTRDGLYSFNAVSVTKLNLGIEKYLTYNLNAVGSCMQDKFYLALRLNFGDGTTILCESGNYVNNALLVINLKDFSFELVRGVDIKSMLPLKTTVVEKLFLTFNSGEIASIGEIDASGKCFSENFPKYYATNNICVKGAEKIVIRKIIVKSTENITLNIVTKEGSKTFQTKDGWNKFETIIPCHTFNIEVTTSEANCKIEHLEIEYYKK